MKKIFSFFLATLMLLGITSCMSSEEPTTSPSYITVEINPGVELVVDENQIVVAANGLNDDGKTLIIDVNFEGITLDVALDLVIKEAEDNGYLVSSSVNAEVENKNISISVTANTTEIQNQIENNVKESVEKLINEENLVAQYNKLEAKSKEFFEEAVAKCNQTLSDAEIKAMSMEELLKEMEQVTTEKAEFATVALEEYYLTFKEYDFTLNHKKEIAEAMQQISIIQGTIYKTILDTLETAIKTLDEIYYNVYVSEESQYLKFLDQINKAKDENTALSIKISSTNTEISAQIEANNKIIEDVEALIKTIMSEFDSALKAAKSAIQTVITKLEEIEVGQNLDYEKILTDFEAKVNENKDATIADFEAKYSQEINNLTNKVKARKTELETNINK